MKLLILGGRGMLGHKVWQVCGDAFECWATVRGDVPVSQRRVFPPDRTVPHVDVRRFETVERAVAAVGPDVIVNCVGVVKQLDTAADPVTSIAINALLPHQLARLSEFAGARLIHISTDCVFSGRAGRYRESDPADADDLYGRSKRLGEPAGARVLTLRTSIIGRELSGAHGLVEWFLSNRGGAVRGFRRAWFSGLTTTALAAVISQIVDRHQDLAGLYHVAADRISKHELVGLLDDAYQAGVAITPDDALEIDRSLNGSRFQAATGWRADPWPAMIASMVADATPYDEWRRA